jgi:hypothetical protein
MEGSQWEKFTVPDTHEVSPFSKNTYHVFVQLEDDSVIAEGATFLTGKSLGYIPAWKLFQYLNFWGNPLLR